MLRIRAGTSNFPNSLYDSGLKKRRIVGLLIIGVMLALFLAFNRIPKLDTVQADLAVATSPAAECFQGFCMEGQPDKSFLSRWWDFSLTYLRLVAVGMTFAFLVAGATEAFVFPKSANWSVSGTGIKGSLKGLAVGPAMNLCSACIVPVASAFRRRGSSIETTLAITQGSSTFNLPALIMAAMVFAPLIGGTRIAVSLVGALLIGPLVAKIVNQRRQITVDPTPDSDDSDEIGWGETLQEGTKEWLRITAGHVLRLGPVMVLAGFASGLAIQWLSPQTVTSWLGDDILGVLIAATIGIAINVPLLFEIPLVAVLLMSGMGTAPAAALLFTAAAAGPITFWGLSKIMPGKAIVAFGASTWALGIVGGILALAFVSFGNGPDFGLRANYASSTNDAPFVADKVSYTSSDWVSTMRFTDVTLSAGISHTHAPPEALLGKTEPRDMVGGAVAEDFDGDGWVDIYVLRGGEAPSLLYMNRQNGTFSEEAVTRGADLPTEWGVAAAAADYDNDGDIDIVVAAQQAPHYLLINDGSGKFSVNDTMITEPRMFATSP
ncbi:MAG: permease, partial [Dehalococcoidia bacterium]|nr:permease [Dehalococcoidia bacterium]